MWHPTEEMLIMVISICVPIMLASIVALYLILRFVPWKEGWKVVKVFACLVSVVAFCFSGYVLTVTVGSHLDYNNHSPSNNNQYEDLKPVIYLYPENETRVDVRLSKPENITCDYPDYGDGWHVIAKPNGDLRDLQTGRDLYCLYYECLAEMSQVKSDGFVVKSADTADFLDEKLEILGLNDKERNEFIIYWLPKLEQNEYNYIRFLTEDEINDTEELGISPKPDTVIRIMMSYKGLDEPIEVEEQRLDPAARAGFTVVEWGGTEIK